MSPAPESSAAVTPNLIAVSNPTAPAIIAAMAAMRAPSNAPLLVPTLVRSRARSTRAKTATASEPSGAGLLLKREARVGAGTEDGAEGGGGGGGGGGAFPGGKTGGGGGSFMTAPRVYVDRTAAIGAFSSPQRTAQRSD
jgi:hypothetical protein